MITARRWIKRDDGVEIIQPSFKQLEKIQKMTCEKLLENMSGYNLIFGSVTAKKRVVFETIGYYDSQYMLIEDYPYNMKLLRSGVKISTFDRIVIRYSTGGISDKKNIDRKYLDESDKIFRNEIKPYVKHKYLSLFKYNRWKRKVKK